MGDGNSHESIICSVETYRIIALSTSSGCGGGGCVAHVGHVPMCITGLSVVFRSANPCPFIRPFSPLPAEEEGHAVEGVLSRMIHI